ncbi:MAG: hypothetical protein LH679_00935, partial [Cyanobacteria bacterium CAN_BIN43]|nr:hypothetical protein [Cyanobacteria bacterium CAN_BIN43]
MSIATDNPTVPVVVSPSAYPLAFPKALASETIPPLPGLRLTTCSRDKALESHSKGYFVPNFRFALHVGSHFPPGLYESVNRSDRQLPASNPFPFGQA